MNGSLSDPLESLKAAGQRQRNAAFNQPLNQNGNGNTNGHPQGGPTQQYNGQQVKNSRKPFDLPLPWVF